MDSAQALADRTAYTPDNYAAIADVLNAAPYQLTVVRIGTDSGLDVALKMIELNIKTGWITVAAGKAEDWSVLSSWTKSKEGEHKSYKAAVYKVAAPDCMHVVNLYNDKVTFADERGEVDGSVYLPALIGQLASCNILRSATNMLCPLLSTVQAVSDPDTAVGKGQFILVNDDDGVHIGVDVNTLQTLDGNTRTPDMQYIETVEAMDLIRDDLRTAFRTGYLGKYKNKLDNQMLFIAAANKYFSDIPEVLDADHDNRASINVEAQRAAWIGSGKAEAAEWDDNKVRAMTFGRTLYLMSNAKILGTMTDMQFVINLV